MTFCKSDISLLEGSLWDNVQNKTIYFLMIASQCWWGFCTSWSVLEYLNKVWLVLTNISLMSSHVTKSCWQLTCFRYGRSVFGWTRVCAGCNSFLPPGKQGFVLSSQCSGRGGSGSGSGGRGLFTTMEPTEDQVKQKMSSVHLGFSWFFLSQKHARFVIF